MIQIRQKLPENKQQQKKSTVAMLNNTRQLQVYVAEYGKSSHVNSPH